MIPAASTVSKLEVALGVNSHLRKHGDGTVPFNARGSRCETENNHKTGTERRRLHRFSTVQRCENGNFLLTRTVHDKVRGGRRGGRERNKSEPIAVSKVR